jgi:hypothetical protein
MSCYERERGTIKLPTAEFAKVRRAVAEGAQFARDEVLAQAIKEFEASPPAARKSRSEYQRHLWAVSPSGQDSSGHNDWLLKESLLDGMVGKSGAMSKPRAAMLRGGPITNRTTVFEAPSAYISFDAKNSTVEWQVDEGNHALEAARNGWGGKALFGALGKVTWTRGTGGTISGNDEYSADEGRGNYNTGAYGPIGASEEPSNFVPFTDSAGVRHEVWNSKYAHDGLRLRAANARMMAKMYESQISAQGRVNRGVPSGGQFSSRGRPDSNIQL